jgi:hypothetical protein
MCAVVRLRALMARQSARLFTNPPVADTTKDSGITKPPQRQQTVLPREKAKKCFKCVRKAAIEGIHGLANNFLQFFFASIFNFFFRIY